MSESHLMSFGAYLTDLLEKYRLSAASVSRILGHKSRTTLRRILTDQANVESMEKFLSEFLEAKLLPLTTEEIQKLRLSLRISQFGAEGYRIRMEMSRLLTTPLYSSVPQAVSLHDVQSGGSIFLNDFFKHLSDAAVIRILIINSPPTDFLEALGRFIPDLPNGKLHIDHYLFLNDDLSRTVRFVAAMLPLMGASCCNAYVIPPAQPGRSTASTLTSSIVVCSAEDKNGRCTEYQLGFTDSLSGELLTFPEGNGVFRFWKGMLEPHLSACVPIVSIGAHSTHPIDCLDISQAYYDLEKNHAIYMIRSDIFPAFLPTDLLIDSLTECCQRDASLQSEQIDDVLERFSIIHQKRFDNIRRKRRVTHVLMSMQSLRAFAQTGEVNASFLPIRPFTAAERRRILTILRDEARDNPYFNIYLPKNDAAPITLDATCYDPVGVLFYHTALITDPQHLPYYTNALISLNDFTELFVQFFREVLLPQYFLSVSATISLFNSLIDSLPEEE